MTTRLVCNSAICIIEIYIVQISKTKTFQVFQSFEQRQEQWQDLVKMIDACWMKDMLKIIGWLNQLKKKYIYIYIYLFIYIEREREREGGREGEFNCKFNFKLYHYK